MLPITKDCAVPEESGVYVEASSILLPTDQPMKTGLCSRVKFTPIAAVCASKLQVRGVIGRTTYQITFILKIAIQLYLVVTTCAYHIDNNRYIAN